MRRPFLVLAAAALALATAACTGSAGPGWTYAPPTPPPPSQPAPSADASAAASAAASGATDSGTVAVSALSIAFEQTSVSAPAGAAFVIAFNNKDAGVPHNIEIKDASGTQVFKGDLVTGPAEKDYRVQALAAGTYTFACTVHPNMTGTLKVGG